MGNSAAQDQIKKRRSWNARTGRARRKIRLVVVAVAIAHAGFYALYIPAWALEDEEQHLHYALTLRDEWRIPLVGEPVDRDIIFSAAETDRWEALGLDRPDSLNPSEMGLEGLSYEAYQPPIYYFLVAQPLRLAGEDPLVALYVARALSVALFATVVPITFVLMRQLTKERYAWSVTGAGLLVASTPTLAAAGGRVNNDILVVVLAGFGLILALRLLDEATVLNAGLLGVFSCAAILTKGTGIVLLGAIAVVLITLWRRGRLSLGIGLWSLVPAAVGLATWLSFTYLRYGVWDGTSAFLQIHRPFEARGAIHFLRDVFLGLWDPYYSVPVALAGAFLWISFVGWGWLRSLQMFKEGLRFLVPATMVLGVLAISWVGNVRGLLSGDARPLLPAYTAAIAVAMAGWRPALRSWRALLPGALSLMLAAIYATAYVGELNILRH